MSFVLPTLRPDQQIVSNFMATHLKCGIWLGIGGGKTLTTLSTLAEIRPAGHMLVVGPLPITRSVWLDEIEKWGFPLRTKSFIVDEQDRKLSRAERLKRFDDALRNDPPTMYFINQEMLTRPSERTRKLQVPSRRITGPLPEGADEIFEQLLTQGPTPREQLIKDHRARTAARDPKGKPMAEAKIKKLLTQLVRSELVEDREFDCERCSGKGCGQCQFGLIDQMPRKRVNGKQTILWPFPTVILDESHGFKSHTSSRFKAMKSVLPAITRLIELTGTPSPNGLLDMWTQMYLLDQGAALGTFSQYREKYFTPSLHVDGRPVKWKLNAGAAPLIHKAISGHVISTENTNIPRPPSSIDPINVTLPKDVLAAYKEFAREQVLDLAMPDPKDPRRLTISAENELVLHGKLMQFASGTIYTGKNSSQYAITHQEKLELVGHTVLGASSNCLIAYRYQSEKTELVKHLRKMGIDAQVFDTSRGMIKAWNDKNIQAMLVHPKNAGPGLNLQEGGSTLIWHTLPDSLGDYEQLNGRLIRPGAPDFVQVWYLVAKDTVDARQPARLRLKEQEQNALVRSARVDVYDPMQNFDELLGDLDIYPL